MLECVHIEVDGCPVRLFTLTDNPNRLLPSLLRSGCGTDPMMRCDRILFQEPGILLLPDRSGVPNSLGYDRGLQRRRLENVEGPHHLRHHCYFQSHISSPLSKSKKAMESMSSAIDSSSDLAITCPSGRGNPRYKMRGGDPCS